jgi:hypothetical protein
MTDQQSQFLSALNDALPLRVLRAARGVGSFITLDLEGRAGAEGWHIWVYLSDWEIRKRGREVLDSSDFATEGAPLAWFRNRALHEIAVGDPQRELKLTFDDGVELTVSPNISAYEPDDDLIMFFRPPLPVLAYSYRAGFYETV